MKALLIIALAAGCVTSGTYNRKVAELTQANAASAAAAKERERLLNDRISALERDSMAQQTQLLDLQARITEAQTALDTANSEKADLQTRLDGGSQLIATMKQRLEKLGQNVDSLIKERSQLTQAMADTAARLEEVRKQEAAAEARAATFHNLVARLRSMIHSGQLKVVIRGGRMIIALPNDILFDSGRTDVKADGKAALAKVAQVLASVPDRNFLVAGHTDNVPIKMSCFRRTGARPDVPWRSSTSSRHRA